MIRPALRIAVLIGVMGTAPSALAEDFYKGVKVSSMLTFQHILTDNRDLGLNNLNTGESYSVQPRVRIDVPLGDNTNIHSDVRALIIDSENGVGAEDETGISSNAGEGFVELRELWLEHSSLFGHIPLSIQAGRQRIREPRALWWNRDFDAVRLKYDSTLFKGFAGIGQNLAAYRTNESDFGEDQEDRFRAFAEGSWQYSKDHFVEARMLYENDYSGIEQVGTFVPANDIDKEDFDLLWFGGRLKGRENFEGTTLAFMDYRLDLMGVAGEEDVLTTGFAAGSSRPVTQSRSRDVFGYGIDAGVNVKLKGEHAPLLSFNYAFGSGDENPNDGRDEGFRQTGLHGNSSRLGLSSSGVRNYGEVLRPELSNLHVISAGLGVPVSTASDVSLFYHYYRLDEAASQLRADGLAANLNNRDKFLGQGADFVINTHLLDAFKIKSNVFDDARLRFNLGAFKAGDAYGAGEDEFSFRTFSELMLRF